jgi:hypothetical protein
LGADLPATVLKIVLSHDPYFDKIHFMEITYHLEQRDFYDALIAHRNRSKRMKWFHRLIAYIIFIFVGIGGFIGIVLEPNLQWLKNFFSILLIAAFYAGILWALPWWMAKNQFSKQPAAHGSKMVSLDSSGVHWRWDGGSSDIEWKNFIRVHEAKSQFLFYSSPFFFNIVPKRAFTPEQLTAFRALIAHYVPHA